MAKSKHQHSRGTASEQPRNDGGPHPAARPRRPNRALLGLSIALFSVWFFILLWLALSG